MNMPKWISSGLIPRPSSGVNGRRSSGFAISTMTPMKKASTTAISPVANGAVNDSFLESPAAATAATAENVTAMNRSEPELPA